MVPANAAVAREMHPLVGEPEKLVETWQLVTTTHGDKPTAKQVYRGDLAGILTPRRR